MSNSDEIRSVLDRVLDWSQERGYAGYSKHDALNSPFLQCLSLNNRLLRLVIIQSVMRSPWNVRPLLGVPRARNPKGVGLFAHAYFDLAETQEGDTREASIAEARKLLLWLEENPSPWADGTDKTELKGLGWGYHYPWQDVGFFQPRNFPNRVVTCWIGFAFIRAYEVTGDEAFLGTARKIADFLLKNPKALVDTESELCLSYVPLEEINWAVMDVSALVSAFCTMLGKNQNGNAELMATAARLMNFVVNKQTDYGAWFYTWPEGDSHIKHDNYHTGIILDCLADYMKYSGDRSHERSYTDGLDYYRKNLFLANGAPKWMNDRVFPHDVHGVAAGVLSFSRASEFFRSEAVTADREAAAQYDEFSSKVVSWAMANLYDQSGYFYHQKSKWITRKYNLMRWGNAWMCRSFAQKIRLAHGR